MSIIDDLLEKTCKNMIKTILSCLDSATKGTIYRVDPMPKLRAVRITSGIRKEGTDEIQWGLPAVSDYNYPGKTWEQYRDRPDHVLEAMGWCVEKQQSWTADNPFEDVRSVRKQLRGEVEDFYHMEPVLVRKVDIYGSCMEAMEYPRDWRDHPIWQDSDYVVVAVIKIHFLPYSIRRDDHSTKLIKELSRSLGTEILTLHLRESLSRSQREFARQRLQSARILAHELRNTLIKFGFIFSAINAQIGVLREEWEAQLRKAFPDLEWKGTILARLNDLIRTRMPLMNGGGEVIRLCKALLLEQQEMAVLPLLPSQGEQWLKNKLHPKWERLLKATDAWDDGRDEINRLLGQLQKAMRLGTEESLSMGLTHLPKDLCEKWSKLVYIHFTPDKLFVLEEILQLLEHPSLPVPHKGQIRKMLRSLKVLVELIPEVEEKASRIILSLRYGSLPDMESLQDLDYICSRQIPYQVNSDSMASFAD